MTGTDKETTNVQERLQNTVAHCMSCYDAWKSDSKNVEARQQLEESVHELRKVTSRIEIELAISDRNNSSLKPMPIPPHRSSKPKPAKKLTRENMSNPNKNNGNSGDNGDNADNKAAAASDDAPKRGRRPKLKTVQAKGDVEE